MSKDTSKNGDICKVFQMNAPSLLRPVIKRSTGRETSQECHFPHTGYNPLGFFFGLNKSIGAPLATEESNLSLDFALLQQ
ncbi:hypothetical protein TNCV_3801031 [Trichonephila clavipes]|nr:hypothetical protein TNCV_3801031 [Trichonephila clavipes]